MTEPSGKIVARPMVTRACGHKQEFQHYEVDKYRPQRLAKFQKTRCAGCAAKLVEEQRRGWGGLAEKGAGVGGPAKEGGGAQASSARDAGVPDQPAGRVLGRQAVRRGQDGRGGRRPG